MNGSGTGADDREQAVWFDVDAPWVRAIEAQVGPGPYEVGDTVTATLTIASDTALDVEVASWLRYPDGREGAAAVQTAPLQASLDNQVVISAIVTDTQMGLHQLLYRLTPAAQVARRRSARAAAAESAEGADGGEGFDIGPAGLDRATTDQAGYSGAADPVQVWLDIYGQSGGPAQVEIALDDGPTTVQALNLSTGYQALSVTLTDPVRPASAP